jgi:hypothetical protein
MKADREKLATIVEEELEVHLQRVFASAFGDRAESRSAFRIALRVSYHLETSLFDRNEMPCKVAAVDRRYVGRLENVKVSEVRAVMPNTKDPDKERYVHLEEVFLVYGKIKWKYTEGGLEFEDDWLGAR